MTTTRGVGTSSSSSSSGAGCRPTMSSRARWVIGGGRKGLLIRASAFHVFTPRHHRDLSSPHLYIQNDNHTQHNQTQGLCPPPWDAPLLDTWRSLRHADFYLYITARRLTTRAAEDKGKEAAVS